jgi:hypothetical protein
MQLRVFSALSSFAVRGCPLRYTQRRRVFIKIAYQIISGFYHTIRLYALRMSTSHICSNQQHEMTIDESEYT